MTAEDRTQTAGPSEQDVPEASPPALGEELDTGAELAPSDAPVAPKTRVGRVWIALVLFAVVLALVLVFVLQNLHHDRVHFLGWSADIPLGVGLLVAAGLGGLAVFCLGSVRIIQLRTAAKRVRRVR